MRLRLVMAGALAFAAASADAQPTIEVGFDASASMLTDRERADISAHLVAAGRVWTAALGIARPVTIDVRVGIAAIATANGASAATAAVGVVAGRDTYEQGAVYELRTSIDVNGAQTDAVVNIGLAYLRDELWFDPDPLMRVAPVPADRTDAMSVFLHEWGHVLAYNGWSDPTSGEPPAGYWSTFDRWMLPGAPTLFAAPASSSSWGSAPDLTTGNNKHWGNADTTAVAPRAARPVQWRDGAPVPWMVCELPLSRDAPPSGDATPRGGGLLDQLMNGVVFYRGTRYGLSALDRALLLDVGLLEERVFASGFDPG
ncbi:MAG: hypothetical protein DI564_13685 [Rhodanobacter denitrificans]|uniref:Uncharacterized protein n=1 Tax=Rhodanobacter denitrificans TaxID=666685 RepID=A0A2W5KAE0_9GAMM|nr:MAG: hypothetical protein DI564_13685 [Rhodanobacter denitrificans]